MPITPGTPIVLADSTDYSSSVSGYARTAQIDLTSLASGAARQSAKIDFGATWAHQYAVHVCVEFATAPSSQETVDVYVGYSNSATAGNDNPGGLSGADAAYSGTSGDSLDDSLLQLNRIGSLVATADATTALQRQQIGVIVPKARYASIVVDNNTSDAFHSDAVEMYVALAPMEFSASS